MENYPPVSQNDDDDDTAANDHKKNADWSMISACRAGMYIPSSPLKAWSFAFDITYHFWICSTSLFHGSLGLLEVFTVPPLSPTDSTRTLRQS